MALSTITAQPCNVCMVRPLQPPVALLLPTLSDADPAAHLPAPRACAHSLGRPLVPLHQGLQGPAQALGVPHPRALPLVLAAAHKLGCTAHPGRGGAGGLLKAGQGLRWRVRGERCSEKSHHEGQSKMVGTSAGNKTLAAACMPTISSQEWMEWRVGLYVVTELPCLISDQCHTSFQHHLACPSCLLAPRGPHHGVSAGGSERWGDTPIAVGRSCSCSAIHACRRMDPVATGLW
jgi:hypothetical protein